ncbi:MAG TPA: SIS domain-containing protein [Kiritimatiellia bacterium]|nr:SIS domain-containing protein [Kiritimatiellia bacterium]
MNWNQLAGDYLTVADQIFQTMPEEIERLAVEMVERLKSGGKLLICGNGGSAADAQHIAGEFINRFLRERKPYAAVALTTDTSVITAIGNDYSYDLIFEKQVAGIGRAEDMLLAISTSGNAENVLQAVQTAKRMGLLTIALTGGTGGKLAPLCDRVLNLSCTKSTPRIQEGHQLIFHILCERIEELLETA